MVCINSALSFLCLFKALGSIVIIHKPIYCNLLPIAFYQSDSGHTSCVSVDICMCALVKMCSTSAWIWEEERGDGGLYGKAGYWFTFIWCVCASLTCVCSSICAVFGLHVGHHSNYGWKRSTNETDIGHKWHFYKGWALSLFIYAVF